MLTIARMIVIILYPIAMVHMIAKRIWIEARWTARLIRTDMAEVHRDARQLWRMPLQDQHTRCRPRRPGETR